MSQREKLACCLYVLPGGYTTLSYTSYTQQHLPKSEQQSPPQRVEKISIVDTTATGDRHLRIK